MEIRRQGPQVEMGRDFARPLPRHRGRDGGGERHVARKSRMANSVWSGVSVIW